MTFANDTVTEQALSRLADNAQITVTKLNEALIAAKRVRDYAKAAQTRALRDSDLGAIKTESLRMASALYFAREHGDLMTGTVANLDTHRKEAS